MESVIILCTSEAESEKIFCGRFFSGTMVLSSGKLILYPKKSDCPYFKPSFGKILMAIKKNKTATTKVRAVSFGSNKFFT